MKRQLYFVLVLGLIFSSDAISDTGTTMISGLQQEYELVFESGISWKNSSLEALYYYSLAYKRPSSFFNIPTNLSIEVGGFSGRRCRTNACLSEGGDGTGSYLSEFDTPIMGLSQEVRLFNHEHFDVSIALGGYLKSKRSFYSVLFDLNVAR